MKAKLLLVGGLLLGATGLSGCAAGVVAGAGTAVGVTAAQDRGVSGALEDTRIETDLGNALYKHNTELFRAITISVHEGKVLLAGTVSKPGWKDDAIRIANSIRGVRTVEDEIRIGQDGGVVDGARDLWITTQLRSAISFDSAISSIHYSIETVNGVVYLLGVGRSQAEITKVAEHARSIRYVKRVVSYVRLREAPASPTYSPTMPDAGQGRSGSPSSPDALPPPVAPAPQGAIQVESL